MTHMQQIVVNLDLHSVLLAVYGCPHGLCRWEGQIRAVLVLQFCRFQNRRIGHRMNVDVDPGRLPQNIVEFGNLEFLVADLYFVVGLPDSSVAALY